MERSHKLGCKILTITIKFRIIIQTDTYIHTYTHTGMHKYIYTAQHKILSGTRELLKLVIINIEDQGISV